VWGKWKVGHRDKEEKQRAVLVIGAGVGSALTGICSPGTAHCPGVVYFKMELVM